MAITEFWGKDVPTPANADGFDLKKYGAGGATDLYINGGYYDYDDLGSQTTFSNMADLEDGDGQVLTTRLLDSGAIYHETPDGNVLLVGKEIGVNVGTNNQNKWYMWLADTTANTFTVEPVVNIGSDGTTGTNGANQGTNVRCLGTSSFLNYNDGSDDSILFGEYSTSSDRTDLAIWKSTDDGATWAIFWRINTNATTNFRHVHGIHQNPYNSRIVVCLGDSNGQACVIQGPHTGDWTDLDDKVPTGVDSVEAYVIANSSDWAILIGQQNYRLIDVAWNHGYMFAYTDAAEGDAIEYGGVWRFAHNFSDTPYRIWQSPYHFTGAPDDSLKVVGGGMLKHSVTEAIIFVDWPTSNTVNDRVSVYALRNTQHVTQIGYIGLISARSNPTPLRMFEDDSTNIWIGGFYVDDLDDEEQKDIAISLSGTHSGAPVRLNAGAAV